MNKKVPRDFLGTLDNVTATSVGAKLVQRGGDFGERRGQLATESWQNGNDRHCNACSDQTVLNCGGTVVIDQEKLHLCDHWGVASPFKVARRECSDEPFTKTQ